MKNFLLFTSLILGINLYAEISFIPLCSENTPTSHTSDFYEVERFLLPQNLTIGFREQEFAARALLFDENKRYIQDFIELGHSPHLARRAALESCIRKRNLDLNESCELDSDFNY
jgi:hypothetical protein